MITEVNMIKAGREHSPVVNEQTKNNAHAVQSEMIEKFFISKCDRCKNRENCKL